MKFNIISPSCCGKETCEQGTLTCSSLISVAGTYSLPDPQYTCTQWEVEATAKRDPVGDQLIQHTAPSEGRGGGGGGGEERLGREEEM